ncbi:MAG TPA: tripartite tricarboxylate transporter substrate binding protein [Burkholderiales bacterium]|nr:tripartite tricarboxylate transporter substrate binding protein [Burkholderiales bacterium]
MNRNTGACRRQIIACISALCSVSFSFAATAQQSYPTRPIRLIVPLAPGGPSDILARSMAQAITPGLGQTVVVDNRTGAGGTIGIDIAAKSPPDGYTMLLVAVATYTINANLYSKLPYDARKDLTPVSILAGAPYILTVHPTLPVKSLKELIALAKARPKDLNYGSGGTGTGPQMAMELLKLQTGMSIVHIPYKGTGPALTEQMAGQVQIGLFNMIAALSVVQSGRLRALAVSGAKRSPALPNVPTLDESGAKGFQEVGGHMIMVPGATPKDIITRLNRELLKALQSPDVLARLKNEGAEVIGSTPEDAAAIIRRDLDKWADVIRRTGIRAD